MSLRTYRITLEYTTEDMTIIEPEKWDWHDLVAPENHETVSLVDVQEASTPDAHLEYFNQE